MGKGRRYGKCVPVIRETLVRVKLLTVSYSPTLGGFDDRALSTFLCDKEILEFRDHFFVVGETPHLTCIIIYKEYKDAREAAPSPAPLSLEPSTGESTHPRSRPDPLSGLDARQRSLFNHMREWRAEISRADGVPPYVILTNKQLRGVVLGMPDSLTALRNIDGIGAGKLERYGARMLEALQGAPPPHGDSADEPSAADAPHSRAQSPA